MSHLVKPPLKISALGAVDAQDERSRVGIGGSLALFATQDGGLHWVGADGVVTDIPGIPPHDGAEPLAPIVQWGGPYAFIKWNQITYIYGLDSEQVVTTLAQKERFYR